MLHLFVVSSLQMMVIHQVLVILVVNIGGRTGLYCWYTSSACATMLLLVLLHAAAVDGTTVGGTGATGDISLTDPDD